MTVIKWITICSILKGLSIMSDCIAAGTDIYQEMFDSSDTAKNKIQFFAGIVLGVLLWPASVVNILINLVVILQKQ